MKQKTHMRRIGLRIFAVLFTLLIRFNLQGQDAPGAIASQSRPLTNFTFIDLKTHANVYVRQDPQFNIEIEAPEEWINKITTEVSSNTLEIAMKNKENWKGNIPVKVYISLPKPNGFEVNGSGEIVAQNEITSDYLSLIVNGSGDIKTLETTTQKLVVLVNGSGDVTQKKSMAENALVEVTGSGSIYGEDIMGKSVSVSLSGSGEIKLQNISTEKLSMLNNGSGSIYETGGMAANVVIENSGSGDIKAPQLSGSQLSVINTGSGNIIVGRSEILEAQLTGSGDIHYYGSPKTIRMDVTGSGRVRQRDQ